MNITRKMIWMLFSIIFLVAGCGRSDRDKMQPTVSITSPVNSTSYISATTPLTIAGTASDNVGVVAVTWSSSTGGSGTCTGTISWTANISLAVGLNTITITAKDKAGNAGTAALAVTYLAPVILSGTVTAPPNTTVDGDVNDLNQLNKSNNSIAEAQIIPNPVTLGGYVNIAGSGATGRSYALGDIDDYYKVSLAAGDSLVLSIADYTTSNQMDIDLYIYNGARAVVASATGTGSSRAINNFSQSGTFYIDVHAVSGASNYILSMGTQTAASTDNLSTESEFVPGQVIVRLKDEGITIAAAQDLSTRASAMGMSLRRGGPGRETLMSFDETKRIISLQAIGVPDDRIFLKAVDEKTQKKLDTLFVVKALRKRPDVESADLNYILHVVDTVPNDTHYNLQWNMPLINLPQAWDTTEGSNSVIVAVVDTGVLLSHPDLAGKFTAGYDFVSDTSMSNDGDGIDDNPDDPGDTANSGSSSFHGTHVTGIIAAATNNSLGVAGVGWNTMIMPVRALGVGGGTEYDILQAVRYAAGLMNDSGTVPAKKADIINLSFGSESSSSVSQAVYTDVRNAGVIIIAAAGNNASSTPFYPASYEGLVSVSAVNINGGLASYSNYGADVDVTAPGGDSGDLNGDGYPDYVASTCGDDSAHILDSSKSIEFNYIFMTGTSMAVPHVAGVAALMKAVDQSMTPNDFDAFLINGDLTDDLGVTGWDENYGYGLIDSYKAVHAAQGGSVPTILKVSPTSLNFGQSSVSASLIASKIGSDALDVTSVSASASWLTVTPSSGLGTYTVQVNRSALTGGSYSAKINFTSSSNTVIVPVQMQINSTGLSPDEGYHYILLIDSSTQETVKTVSTKAANGIYSFTFTNVPQGIYQIFSGSDRDNDGYIGDAGEALGAYQSADQPTDIAADQDLSGLDFSTSYQVTLPAAVSEEENRSTIFLRNVGTTKQVKLLAH